MSRATLLSILFSFQPFAASSGFIADTMVLTAEGPVYIKNIKANDRVLSFDQKTGKIVISRVRGIFQEGVDDLARIVISNEEFYLDINHRFYNVEKREWTPACDLAPGIHLVSQQGDYLSVDQVERVGGPGHIFDLNVEDTENYFVGKQQVLVHNFPFAIPAFPWVIGRRSLFVSAATFFIITARAVFDYSAEFPRATLLSRTRLDPLPRTQHGVPIPEKGVEAPHTQLGTKQGSGGPYRQAREFDAEGKPVRDINFTDHGRPGKHPNPHQHRHIPNPTGGTPQRGGPESLSQ